MEKDNINLKELLLKTVGLMESLPERIERLEDNLKILEIDYREHKAVGDVNCKSHQEMLKREIETIKKEVELLGAISKTLSDTDLTYDGRISVLEKDYKKRESETEEHNKNIREYKLEAIKKFIGLLVVSGTIITSLIIGIPKEYIPWAGNPPVVTIADTNTLVRICTQQDGSINESDLKVIVNKYPNNFSHSKINKSQEYYFIHKEYIQLINKTGYMENQIKINRGK